MTEIQVTALTDREKAILALAASGRPSSEIAAMLRITERTVVFHSGLAVRKLNARNKTHAIAIALTRGMIRLEGD